MLLRERFDRLPTHTAYASRQLLEQVEALDGRVRECEKRIQATFKPTPVIQPLLTLPGVGLTLAVVIALEVGDVTRFATAERLASYAGTPRASRRAAGRPDSVPRAPTSIATSSGPLSKRRTRCVSRAGARRLATSVGCMNASRAARVTPRRSGRWPGIWPTRRIGC